MTLTSTVAERWALKAEAAVAGTPWLYVNAGTFQSSADLSALYRHEDTGERRRVRLSGDTCYSDALRVDEIHRQLGLDGRLEGIAAARE